MNEEINNESRQYIKVVADEILIQFENIAKEAQIKLNESSSLGANVFASINTMTSESTMRNLNSANRGNQETYRILSKEPAIARVVAVDEEGKMSTYYICRTTPVSVTGNLKLASYRAPVGRLASLQVGSEFELPNGNSIEVLERALLRPAIIKENWDSLDTKIQSREIDLLSIKSLRSLLTEVVGEPSDNNTLEKLLAEESARVNIIEGVRRNLITKMGLRDQPVLDQYQDEIFRLPLNKRLLLLGPPGTGKTTTLIRRLGQKLDLEFLDESERRLVESVKIDQYDAHTKSWLMFTPTELLKQYLKEAFAREEVPASDCRIKTWQEYRYELARNTFDILKSVSNQGQYIFRTSLCCLKNTAKDMPTKWYEDFNKWQYESYVEGLFDAATSLDEAQNAEAHILGEKLQDILTQSSEQTLPKLLGLLETNLPKLKKLTDQLKEKTDKRLKQSLSLQVNRDDAFLDELAHFLDSIQKNQLINIEEQDDIDSDDEQNEVAHVQGRAAAFNAYMQAVKAQARSSVSKRKPTKKSRSGQIIEWLGDRGLPEEDCEDVGSSLLVQMNARRFLNPVGRYMKGIPKRYRAYRKLRQKEGVWYEKEGFEAKDISPLELDIVLLVILRTANELLSRSNVLKNLDAPLWSPLQPILALYRHQVMVDEATDFSAIQLGCMAALTHPRLRSFFACGDFNQRLTSWGARSTDELKWVFADLDIREVNISYRQSEQLNALADDIIKVVGAGKVHASLPKHVDSHGVAAALLENTLEQADIITWLSGRIKEIESFVGQLPSIAVFVNSEAEVTPLAKALGEALGEDNIQVLACHEGQAVGQESSVRIFDLQHIKGLEFEAVFFIGIDTLAKQHPDLFDKYLYVGITRAATYLGVTCEGILPENIESLRPHFGKDWQQV